MPIIGLLIIWLAMPIIAIWQILSSRRKFIEKTCPGCEYDLTGASVGSPCPECGIIPAISRSKGSNSNRVLCRNCGHDLEGLEWDADCPECGLQSAALPRFEPAKGRYRIRAVLGSVLLAMWLGITFLIVMEEIMSSGTTMQNAGGGARAVRQANQLQQQVAESKAAEQPDASASTPPSDADRD